MKHINLPIESAVHERYKALLNVTWNTLLEAGLEIVELCGSYAAYQDTIKKIKDAKPAIRKPNEL